VSAEPGGHTSCSCMCICDFVSFIAPLFLLTLKYLEAVYIFVSFGFLLLC